MVKSPQTPQQKEEGQHHSIANEGLNEDLILHSWRLVKGQVQRVIEFNRSQGVPNPDAYNGYNYADGSPEPMSVEQKLRWLNIIRHKKSGRPITVDSLVASGRISDIEKEIFGQRKYPRIELSAMTRVKTQDNLEYIMRHMRAIGLSEIGAIVTLPLNDCDLQERFLLFLQQQNYPTVRMLKYYRWELENSHMRHHRRSTQPSLPRKMSLQL